MSEPSPAQRPRLLCDPGELPHVPTGTEADVCADIARRQAHGLAKYGTSVRDNPLTLRQWLQHAYEEHLDAAVYLKRAMEALGPDAGTGPAPGVPGTACKGCPAPCRFVDACPLAPDGSEC